MRSRKMQALLVVLSPVFAAASMANAPVPLSQASYSSLMGVVLLQVNWGRSWQCGQYQNVQIQMLEFTHTEAANIVFELRTPSKLQVNDEFVPYALVVAPGQYQLTDFDVKVASSRSRVEHITLETPADGKPALGTFEVTQGEVVYIGHFGLDCESEPFIWRYYVDGRDEFERYIEGFRSQWNFMQTVPVTYRLFSTEWMGYPNELADPVVE